MSKILNFKKFLKICTVTVWEEGISSCDVSLTPKNIYFLQLIICCWLELDMSLLDMTEFKIGVLVDWDTHRGSQKVKPISQLSAPMRPI